MKPNRLITRLTLVIVALTLCGVPEMMEAQNAHPVDIHAQQEVPASAQQPDAPAATGQIPSAPADANSKPQSTSEAPAMTEAQSSTEQQAGPAQSAPQENNGIIDPSKGPLTPVPSNTQELPNAPSAAQTAAQKQVAPQSAPAQAPAGAAAAQTGPTAGGVASKPAGNAIAPAKQRQVRSLLIKLGAIAAAGAAIGTVVALSKGSPSTPPGTR